MTNKRVLVIDDDPAILDLLSYQLREQGFIVDSALDGKTGVRLASEQPFAIALTDLHLPDIDGIDLVRRLKEVTPQTEIIMITGYSSMARAIDAIKAGAFHFVEKPVSFDELLLLIEKALERRTQAIEISQLRERLQSRDSYFNIIGSSKGMQTVYEIIDRVADSDANIMIVGESGTGKELIANAIHFKSLRSKKPFVKINCSALPKELIESELFGHTKGAFTGAASDNVGLIGQAHGGSLMLDEIGEMPVELQPKLLRVLQERVYHRLGSEKALEADFRLISATNRDPALAMREGHLREDLYYRINTIEIRVPPLRARTEDIQHLAEHFLRLYAEKYGREAIAISQTAYSRMFDYSWPGNVRELQNVIERAVLLSKGDTLEESSLPANLTHPARSLAVPEEIDAESSPSAATANGDRPSESDVVKTEISSGGIRELGKAIVSQLPEITPGVSRNDVFLEIEQAVVAAALERTHGNKQAAANLLGIYRPRLYHMLRKHGEKQGKTEKEPEDAELNGERVTGRSTSP